MTRPSPDETPIPDDTPHIDDASVITGGTRDFRRAHGTALVQPLDGQGQRQSVRLIILR